MTTPQGHGQFLFYSQPQTLSKDLWNNRGGGSFCFCLIKERKNHPFRPQMPGKIEESVAQRACPSRKIDKWSKDSQNQLYLTTGKELKICANHANAHSGKRRCECGRKALCVPCPSLISFPSMACPEDGSLRPQFWREQKPSFSQYILTMFVCSDMSGGYQRTNPRHLSV